MDNALLYVDDSVSDPRMSKVLVRVGHAEKLKVSGTKRQRVVSNPVRTATYVKPEDLANPRYVPLDGRLDDE